MKVGYLSMTGISDPSVSSGTPYFIAQTLNETFGTVFDLSPNIERAGSRLARIIENPGYSLAKVFYALKKRKLPHIFDSGYQKIWARTIESNIERIQPDIIFADKCSVFFPYLKTDVPIFYRSDSTFELMNGYYSEFSDFSRTLQRAAHSAEAAAFNKSRYFIPISSWAAESAVKHYSVPTEKCVIIRSHASLANEAIAEPKQAPAEHDPTNFLFIGADWNRKGGALTVEALTQLHRSGRNIRLNILCKNVPEAVLRLPFVTHLPYIDRSTNEGNQQYFRLFADSHFFFMPTRAECMGQVFIDALMLGLPSIALETGAVPEVVINDKTGLIFPLHVAPEVIAMAIDKIFEKPEQYSALSKSSIHYYKTEFSKAAFVERMSSLIKTTQNA